MIFVFGSNLDGYHAGGAARVAQEEYGALSGMGFGFAGQSYAIPTVGHGFGRLPLATVRSYIDRFIDFASSRADLEFQVTRIGCGIAGFADGEIAPLFAEAPVNCLFDEAWEPYLNTNARIWGTF